MKLLYVEWIDPHSVDSWTEIEELVKKAFKIISCGIFVYEDDEIVILSLNKSTDKDEVSCTMIIPKECIRKRKWIKI